MGNQLSKDVHIVVEAHYSGQYVNNVRKHTCLKTSWLDECFEAGHYIAPTARHQWKDNKFGGLILPEPSLDYVELPVLVDSMRASTPKKSWRNPKSEKSAVATPKRGNNGRLNHFTPAALASPQHGTIQNEYGDDLSEGANAPDSMDLPSGEKSEALEMEVGLQVDESGEEGEEDGEEADETGDLVRNAAGDQLMLIPPTTTVSASGAESVIPKLLYEVMLRYDSSIPKMEIWPEDTAPYTTRPRTRGNNDITRRGGLRSGSRPVFPDELLTVPRYQGDAIPHTRFRPEEDAAMLIWMVRALPLIGLPGFQLRTFQSPCLWHWAQQAEITQRDWQTMKSRERNVLRHYFSGAVPLPDAIYKLLKHVPYFIFEGQKLARYNRTAVEKANLESKNHPAKHTLIASLRPPPPTSTPGAKKRSGPELKDMAAETLNNHQPETDPQNEHDTNNGQDESMVDYTPTQPPHAKRKKLKEVEE